MAKKLIVCCDGTWNSRKQPNPTNVWRFHQALADKPDQRRHYHAGVGTNWRDRYLGGIFGFGLSHNVLACYRWLVENYEPGDELFLLGFSRGAFTARSLGGLIRNVGILRPGELGQLDAAYALYRTDDGPDSPAAIAFREQYSLPGPVPIEFIGVWDTVGALGVPAIGLLRFGWLNRRWAFHDVQLSSRVRHAFHALALDERRQPFLPTLWQPQPDAVDQVVEQVWFAGVHCDVGGGYPEHDLADITLHWMADHAKACGVAFGSEPVVPPNADRGPLHDSLNGIYKVAGPAVREPGVVDPVHEYLSSTAAHRIAADAEYGTQPARAYLVRGDQQLQV